MKKCHFIGTGKLGQSLAYALQRQQLISLCDILNRQPEHSLQAVANIGQGRAMFSYAALNPADLIFICAPDDALSGIVDNLLQANCLSPSCFVIHCSGALSSEELQRLKARGCQTASLHPLKSFSHFQEDSDLFKDVYCAIEGDHDVIQWLEQTLKALQAKIIPISTALKPRYHAAAAIAANYLICLADMAGSLFESTGIDAGQAKCLVRELMQSCLDNLSQSNSTAEALTGPIARGDVNTVQLHLQALDDPLIKAIYQKLGQRTVGLSRLSEEKKRTLLAILEED